MGSEHYCLRWNNHQSNLLGVFSQLLQDESLVDVTLACAEGLSIRAHKVVLSACSSYFQTLFVDHPNRHPIVILKDVRFAELRTLVEFMYKGEVNVEYCQLSALLKTAESLKVKGLAEMTNAREDNREGDDGASVQKHNSPGPPDTPTPEIPASASGSKRLMDEDSATATSLHPHGSISPSPALYGTKRQMLHHRHDSGSCDEGGGGAGGGTPEPDDLSSPPCAGPSDMSMSCNNPPSCSAAAACSSALSSRLPSPLGEEPLPGPSGMLPVQQVPLSLKKEVEWDRGGDDKSTTGDSSSDYRHPHDPEVVMVEGRYGPSCAVAALSRHRGSESQASSRSSTPFQFPFPSFAGGFPGPLVVDPIGAEGTGRPGSSILSLLQQQGLIGSPPLSEDGRNSVGPLPTGLFRCTICLAAFPSAWLLEQHSNLQHSLQSMQEDGESGEEKPFRCDQCGQSYRYRSAYLKHREQNHRARLPADKLFTCDVCGMQFRYLKSFKKHRLNHALERLHAKPDLFNASRKFLAEPSSVDYSSKMLTMMMQGGRPNGDVLTSYGVRESGRVTAPPTSTVTESVGSDQVSSSNEAVGSNAVEETPGTSFERSASVPVSKTEQHNFYKFSLDDYYYYGSGSNLAEGSGSKKKSDRLVMDSGDQDETIDSLAFALSMASNSGSGAGTAGEVFRSAQEASLLNLLRLDAAERQRERRFACPFCGKCVRSKENLKLHVRKHTGERPFVCLFCGRAFGGKSDLTRHLRIHTGERPYHCEMCGKCFARADYLSKHLTTHIHSSQR